MCGFFSCLVTKNDVLYDLNIDSHEDLIKKFNLHDNTTNPTFVRIECIPKDGNIFNHESTNWETRKDQDCIPDWFDIREVDKLVKKELKTVFKKLFVSKGSVKIDNGRLFVNGSASVIASGSASVKAYESASVEAWGSASVEAYGESNIIAFNKLVTLHENAKMIDRTV